MSTLSSPLRPITGVLAATDLHHGSNVVLGAAASIARAAGARLHGAYVLTPDAVPRAERARDPEIEDDVLEEARRGLWIQMAQLEAQGTEMASAIVVRKRSAHEGIVDVARASGVDLIVMGSHGRASAGPRLGSTADRVLRTSPVPCLVIRGEPTFPVHRAAVLTDFSPPSRAALRLALSWLPSLGLSDPGAQLDVLHVGWPEVPQDQDQVPPHMLRRVQKEIGAMTAAAHAPPHTIRPRIAMSSYPVDATVAEARAQHYQMIVVGTHGGGALSRALIGSVALGLMHAAPCPVLVVPRPGRRR